MYKFFLAGIILLSVIPELSYSQTDTALKVNSLEEVEVRAMYSPMVTRRFPAAVYTVSAVRNDILLPVNINESLNKIPSVYAHTGTFNTSRITMRGIGTRSLYGTRKINALLNDIPLTSGEGDTFIDDIDLRFIGRIEVVGGPTAGIYGPALGGTLLLYPKTADGNNSFEYSAGTGSYGTFHNSLSSSVSTGSTGVVIQYKNVQSDGYRENNSYNRNSAMINLNTKGGRSDWNFIVLFTSVRAGIPSSIDSLSYETKPTAAAVTWAKTKGRENTQRVLTGITYQYKFSETLSSTATFFGLYKKSWEVRPFNYMFEDDRSGGVKINFKKRIADNFSITPGVSLFVEKYSPSLYENLKGEGNRGAKIAENVENILQANAYILAEYTPDIKSFLSVSLNVNKFGLNDRNVFASEERQIYRPQLNFSPRISYSRQLVMNHFVFGSISHGLSYPSVQEILYPDGSINSNVRPENAWSFEGGFKGVRLFRELKYSVAAYYMPVQDLIVPERIAEDTYIGRNVGRSLHAGLEVLIEKAIPVSDRTRWFYLNDYRISYNWQSNKFLEFYHDSISLKGNDLPGVPGNKLFLSLSLKAKNLFFIEPELYINGRTAMNDVNTRIYKAYQVANLRFGFLAETRRWNAKLAAAINNITNEKYASMILINAPSANNRPPRYYYPGLPRNYFLSFSIGYSL